MLEASSITAPDPGATTAPATLNVEQARTATQADAAAIAAWLDGTAAAGAPTLDERVQAAMGAQAIAEVTGSAPPSTSAGGSSGYSSTEQALNANFGAAEGGALSDAAAIVGETNSTPAREFDTNSTRLATPVTILFDGIADSDTVSVEATVSRLSMAPGSVLWTPLANARALTAVEPTDVVGAKAATSDVPAVVANWSTAARDEISARFDSGALEDDTLNLSLASQALRADRPAAADALNAELRYRQTADGSIGPVPETSEAARALAQGPATDRDSAIRALNWLDRQGTLPADLAVYRLRAHAFDGALVGTSAGGAAPEPAQSMSFGIRGPDLSTPGGKSALALWLLVGGIGLSLSLVTVDALRGSRQRLFDTIRSAPGLHVNELRRRLHMSPSSIEYHLSVLVGSGLVVAEDDGRYKRYYANGAGLGLNPRSPNSRNTLGALRRPHAVTLVRALLAREQGSTARELSRTLTLHESAVARRLAHLEDAGVLSSERVGRARLYRLRDPSAALKGLAAVEEAPPVFATEPAEPFAEPGAEEVTAQAGARTASP